MMTALVDQEASIFHRPSPYMCSQTAAHPLPWRGSALLGLAGGLQVSRQRCLVARELYMAAED